jgi:hypothetical protein
MIPLNTEIVFLDKETSELRRGSIRTNGKPLGIRLVDSDLPSQLYRVNLDDVVEVWVEKVWTVIVTNTMNGKTRAKSYYIREKAASAHRKAFEKSHCIVSFSEHRLGAWIVFSPKSW